MAMYDRFGYLLLGDPDEEKDVLEYVVFENHVSSLEGIWRMHDKVYPHWLPKKQSPIDAKLVKEYRYPTGEEPPKEPARLGKGHQNTYIQADKEKRIAKAEAGDLPPEQREQLLKEKAIEDRKKKKERK